MEQSENDIVISGISGRFPSSNNVQEFAENLYNKVDMTDDDESRWKHFHKDVPKRFGKIRNLEKFDTSFFSTLKKHANWTDPQMRMLLEHAYESILDAGVSPQSLIGSKTGVFIGCSISDSKDAFTQNIPPKDGYVVLGNGTFYLSNRISYALGLCGPSFTLDTACSSSAYALDCAYRYIESGLCDAALVGGTQLILNCGLASEYTKLGILAPDGVCRPFDADATGFSRAETICVAFLQKRKDSKRIYANVVYSSSNNDGFKKEGSTFPSKVMQQTLIENFYKTINFDPENVNIVEAHSTGTKLGDPEEVAAIDEVFCKNSNRSKELIIGSVKSNMGHAEAASGMASIAKILLSLESGKFPPNINLTKPRSDIPAFAEGRIKVALECEQLDNEFIAMNSFGLGGANAHSLFRRNSKEKVNFGIPNDNFGRMVLWSGRTEDSIKAIFEDITKRPLDAEHIALLQNSQVKTTSANTYRGFGMFVNDETQGKAVCVKQNIQYFNGTRRPIVFVYSGIGSQWLEMGKDLMKIPLFAKSIDFCHNILLKKGIDLKSIMTSTDEKTFDNVMNSYVGIVSIEIALTDLLKELGVNADFVIGHSVGELGCAYADNCLTAEETILAAHARGQATNDFKTIAGAMAAVGMHYAKLEEILPEDIDIACHNGEDSTTISGPEDSINRFIEDLQNKKIFVKAVQCSGIPLHSRYISRIGQILYEKLKTVIQVPKARSRKWLSSTFPEDSWNTDACYFSSAEYHMENLLNPVYFQEVTEMLPKNSLTIEVSPHGLLKSILKRNLKEGMHCSLTQKECKDGFEFLMESLGCLFQNGVDIDIAKLYPQVEFPVSRRTPMISPVIKWNHEENIYVPYFDSYNTFERRNFIINISDRIFEIIQGHIVDGRVLFPATGWIYFVWETFARMVGENKDFVKVVIEDIHFLRATSLVKNQDVLITVAIHRGSGRFEIIEGNSPVVNGFIKKVDEIEMSDLYVPDDESKLMLLEEDFYKEMRLGGFCHLGVFKGVKEIRTDGCKGKIKWFDWITFLDSMTHFEERRTNSRKLAIPTYIRKIVIDPILHNRILEEKKNKVKEEMMKLEQDEENHEELREPEILFDAFVSPYMRLVASGGVEIHDKYNLVVNRRRPKQPLLEILSFVPYFSEQIYSLSDATKIIVQTVLENLFQATCMTVEIDDGTSEPISDYISKALRGLPQVISDVNYISSKEDLNLENVKICTEDFTSFNGADLIIKSNCVDNEKFLEQCKSILDNGYIISREKSEVTKIPDQVQVIAKIPTDTNEIFYILEFKDDYKIFKAQNIIEISSNIDDWLEPLKASLKAAPTVIYGYNNEPNGILGFFNCIRREYNVGLLKCFFIIDTENAPKTFDLNNSFFRSQFELNHAVNVFKDGKWGNYKHLDISAHKETKEQEQHCFVDCTVKGDLSTLTWLNGDLDLSNPECDIIKIQYASLNFKDVMLALGRIPDECNEPTSNQYILGFEFSGTNKTGQKVMGIGTKAGALATHYDGKKAILWSVPDKWTLEEAATVPLVYFTVYYAFFCTTTIKAGKKILIHSGSGGVGQAAIHIALAYGLEVFTTVGTEEKKNFLLQKFPQLKSQNIGNSRSTSFEKMIQDNTKGNGVDYVLNSLSEEKLQASIRCLGKDGVFLEIGKYDMIRGTKIDMRFLMKRITIKAVNFDDLSEDSEEMKTISRIVEQDLKSGIVKPLNTTVFDADKVEDAFRYMASGKHIGKVLLKVRHTVENQSSLALTKHHRIYFDANESLVIAGGLGGFGLELAEWSITRGCRNLILSSSRGIKNSNQLMRFMYYNYLGARVEISLADITTKEGCEELLNRANELAPVGGIFNLAGVLRDGIFDNLDLKMFTESLAPKALATKYLDEVSRSLCPSLKHFVVFSSVSCGHGNPGQSNYGMSNSIMERIVEKRQQDGFPGKAIQWGAVGDVGMLAEFQLANMNKDIGGTLPQAISSCLESMDILLASNSTIVSSMVLADKNVNDFRKGNVIDIILNIMGIRDKKSISMDSTLTQLGIDSLMGVEIQQVIEREFDVSFVSQELRTLTLAQLEKRVTSKNSADSGYKEIDENAEKVGWIKKMMEGVIDSKTLSLVDPETIVKANDVEYNGNLKILIIPGFYGFGSYPYVSIAKEMNFATYILQLYKTAESENLDRIVNYLAPNISELFDGVPHFIIIAHSFGTLLSLKFAKILEDQGKSGQIVQLDGSPKFIQKFTHKNITDRTDDEIASAIAMVLFSLLLDHVEKDAAKNAFEKSDHWVGRLKVLVDSYPEKIKFDFDTLHKNVIIAYITRIRIAHGCKEDDFAALQNTNISLIKVVKPFVTGFKKDLELSNYCNNEVAVRAIDGDHVTMLLNKELPSIIKSLFVDFPKL